MQENMIPNAGDMTAMVKAMKQTIDRLTARIDFFKEVRRRFERNRVITFTMSFIENKVRETMPQRRSAKRRHKKKRRAKKADKKASFFEVGSLI